MNRQPDDMTLLPQARVPASDARAGADARAAWHIRQPMAEPTDPPAVVDRLTRLTRTAPAHQPRFHLCPLHLLAGAISGAVFSWLVWWAK